MCVCTAVLGGYTSDHQVIVMFWRVIENFTDTQRRQLLKFVTSCSRPPLLGFKVSPLLHLHLALMSPGFPRNKRH